MREQDLISSPVLTLGLPLQVQGLLAQQSAQVLSLQQQLAASGEGVAAQHQVTASVPLVTGRVEDEGNAVIYVLMCGKSEKQLWLATSYPLRFRGCPSSWNTRPDREVASSQGHLPRCPQVFAVWCGVLVQLFFSCSSGRADSTQGRE